jgi:hypothetical protein
VRGFENRVLRDTFEIKREEVKGNWRKYILRNFKILPLTKPSGD